ncbi:segregation/condensation protein A [candidate division KSB1 bacterium]|nr:segregation/condensation protein A [candidate division KSB1 bacterium]
MAYRVRLENFEGPLDLLLFLIKKNEVDIYDIPIAEITRQFLEYIDIITILDLEVAGDFLVIASTLIRIKVQMLLPKPQLDDDEEQVIDPRLELVTKLLEYKRFKEVAHKLHEIEDNQLEIYGRSYFDYSEFEEDDEIVIGDANVSLFSLIHAFKQIIQHVPKVTVHEIKNVEISTQEQSEYILKILQHSAQISFVDLISRFTDRIIMVVTFIAVLDLIRQELIIVNQAVPFGEIWIRRK